MKIHLILIILFFLNTLNCEEEIINNIISENSLKETLINIFPVLKRESPPHEIPEKDEFKKMSFEFMVFTPNIFTFKFDKNGILNTDFDVDIILNGTVHYNATFGPTKSKFRVKIKNLNIKEKIKLNITIKADQKYEIEPIFISDPEINYSSRITFIDTFLGDIDEMKENIKKNLLEIYFIKYIRLYNKNVIELTIKYNQFLNIL